MKTHVHIIIESEVKARLEELADSDGRSLNNLINKILTDRLSELGAMPLSTAPRHSKSDIIRRIISGRKE